MRLLAYIRSIRARQQRSKQLYIEMTRLASAIATMIAPTSIHLNTGAIKELTREVRAHQEAFFIAFREYNELVAKMTLFEMSFAQDRLIKETKVIKVRSAQVSDAAYLLKYNATHAKELTA